MDFKNGLRMDVNGRFFECSNTITHFGNGFIWKSNLEFTENVLCINIQPLSNLIFY